MIIFKKKGKKFNQDLYDLLFNYIENDLRELGFGDVSVNKKMKELNKILYDILLKLLENDENNSFKINKRLICKYFKQFDNEKMANIQNLKHIFIIFLIFVLISQ